MMRNLFGPLVYVVVLAALVAVVSRLFPGKLNPLLILTVLCGALIVAYHQGARKSELMAPKIEFKVKHAAALAIGCLASGGWTGVTCLNLTGNFGECIKYSGSKGVNLLVLVIVSPVIEEIILRGYVSAALLKKTKSFWLTAILQGVIFAVPHSRGFDPAIFLFFVGWAACLFYVAQLSMSLVPAILFHWAWNLVSIGFTDFNVPVAIDGSYEMAVTCANEVFILVSIVVAFVLHRRLIDARKNVAMR